MAPVTGNVASKKVKKADIAQEQRIEYDYSNLEREIDEILGKDASRYSAYVYYPDSKSEPLLYKPRPMRSASMIKVFVMAYAMEQISQGKLNFNDKLTITAGVKADGAGIIAGWANGSQITIKQLLEYMITESDNTATNMLIFHLGMDEINDYIQRNGYKDTKLQRKMMDYSLSFYEKMNITSAEDLGKLFGRIYSGQCVNEEYDEMMVDMLLDQKDVVCLPEALPETRVAHKTGELNNLYDDGGIVYTGDIDFVIVVMDEDVPIGIARENQKDIARAVYNHRLDLKRVIYRGKIKK